MSGPTFEVFTLFPAAISGFLRGGLVGKALEQGLVQVHCTDYRDFATDRYRTVDDAPYGGGPGMVMKIEPVVAALERVTQERGPMHRVVLTPSAPRFDQRAAERLARMPRIGLLCGRYEGIDDRVREHYADECLSLGDFVLNGGEVAALAIIESVSRLCEGVLGNPDSAARDSFSTGDMSQGTGPWLEFPQYTRPPVFRDHAVPERLLAGDHAAIARWRLEQAWRRTWALRPEIRPRRALPAGTPVYLAVLTGAQRGEKDRSGGADLSQALAPIAAAHGARLALVGTRSAGPRALACRDVKELRRTLRREHGAAPRIVWLGASGSWPVADSGAALLDLLACAGEGDLSAPLVLLVSATPFEAGDLAHLASELPQRPPEGPLRGLEAVEAAFAPTSFEAPRKAPALAQTPAMIDSSGPQPVCGAAILAAAALTELCTPTAR